MPGSCRGLRLAGLTLVLYQTETKNEMRQDNRHCLLNNFHFIKI